MTSKASRSPVCSSVSNSNDSFLLTVQLLEDDNSMTVCVPETAYGLWLLEEICIQQEVLPEIEYFGLRYVSCELLSAPTKHWMNLTKSVRHQLKHTNPLVVSFRIKHYPPDPITEFKLDKSKYLLFHQIHRDFLSGRLIAPHDDNILLAALFIQVALGDASEMITTTPLDYKTLCNTSTETTNNSSQPSTYLSNYRALHNANKKYEPEILEQHRKLEGLLPSEAASEAIRIALRQLSYGMEPLKVQPMKQKNSRQVYIGLTHEGVAEFTGSKRSHLYKWTEIDNFYCSGRSFIFSCKKPGNKRERKTSKSAHENVGYRCESRAVASELWSWATERKLFFTLEKSTVVKPITSKYNLFSRRHTFNFSGRCRSELMNSKPQSAILPNPKPLLIQNNGQPSLPASTTGLLQSRLHHLPSRHHPHHYRHHRSSRRSTLSSIASHIQPSKSISDGNMASRVKANDVNSIVSSAAFESQQSMEEVSDAGSISTVETPTFVLLAPYFESIPNRKYASLSRIRQQQCVNLATDPSIRSLNSMDDIRLNGILSQTILEDREPICEVKPSLNYAPLQTSTPNKQNTGNQLETPKFNALPKPTTTTTISDNTDNSKAFSSNSCRTLSRLWRYVLVTGGLSLLIIVLGTSLATEVGYQGPLVIRFRGSSLFMNWESYCYHPLRSLLLGMFQ